MSPHTGKAPCENCNEAYRNNYLLKRHKKRIHVPLGKALYNGESEHETITYFSSLQGPYQQITNTKS